MRFRLSIGPNGHLELQKYEIVKCIPRTYKKSGKEKQEEVEEEAPSNTLRAFLKEHNDKTKEEKTLLYCPFAALKLGCSLGGSC
jgi:hypothetical protein